MLLTFSSKAYENITMTGDTGKQLLALMGQSGTIPGAIAPEDIPRALSQLESAVKNPPTIISNDDEDEEPEVSLAQRSFPLRNMLNAALKQQCHVMWE